MNRLKATLFHLVTAVVGAAILFPGMTYSQTSATADVFAEVASAISIVKIDDLQFGAFVVGPLGGTLTVEPTANTLIPGDDVLPISGRSVQPAKFIVSGQEGFSFAIDLPDDNVVKLASNGDEMELTDFTTDIGLSDVIGPGGEKEFLVGATLHVGPNQAPGSYEASFSVQVAYE